MSTTKKVQIGILGCGTVGSGVLRALLNRRKLFLVRSGVELVLKKVVTRDPGAKKGLKIPRGILTSSVGSVLEDPSIDIVVEVIGGIHPAKEYILRALKNGKHVVTANKALLAEEGEALFTAAKKAGRELRSEERRV